MNTTEMIITTTKVVTCPDYSDELKRAEALKRDLETKNTDTECLIALETSNVGYQIFQYLVTTLSPVLDTLASNSCGYNRPICFYEISTSPFESPSRVLTAELYGYHYHLLSVDTATKEFTPGSALTRSAELTKVCKQWGSVKSELNHLIEDTINNISVLEKNKAERLSKELNALNNFKL